MIASCEIRDLLITLLASDLKDELQHLGMSAFVAHNDIQPSREWQDEIRMALSSMHMLVTLLTDEFRGSNWTDQEVGFALGLGIPALPVKVSIDPYGFLRSIQAVSGTAGSRQWAVATLNAAFEQSELKERATDAFIGAVSKSRGFAETDTLFETYLPKIKAISPL